MLVNNKNYKTIWATDKNKIFIIDQTLLPFTFKEIELRSLNDVAVAISSMQVRGAPLIGITAAFGIYLAMLDDSSNQNLESAKKILLSTRPTAINLKWALEKITSQLLEENQKDRVAKSLIIAKKMASQDEEINQRIGDNGCRLIEEIYKKKGQQVNILTHCNAGWLATVDWGTATAPIYKARDKKIPIHVWVDETRPRNQGSSLTAWELNNENISCSIITDNAGGHMMQQGMVDMVITGSDRTTFRGDVCNKIGTYLKALAANDNNIPFYVALPSSTIDWKTDNFKEIKIEERNQNEIHFIQGKDQNGNIVDIRITPENIEALNYAFDTTPSKYISALITENGVCKANEKDIKKINEIN